MTFFMRMPLSWIGAGQGCCPWLQQQQQQEKVHRLHKQGKRV